MYHPEHIRAPVKITERAIIVYEVKGTALHDAVRARNVEEVRKLLAQSSKEAVNSRDKFQQTPLHIACVGGNMDIVEMLLAKDADPNLQDRNGWTTLHCAASSGNLEICTTLLESHHADPSIVNKDGTSALHYLVRSEFPERKQAIFGDVVRSYREARGDLNSQNRHGESALHQACQRGNARAVRVLVQNKCTVNISNK